MQLTPDHVKRLSLLLQDLFTVSSFDQMLWVHCEKKRESISTATNFTDIIFTVIQEATRQSWVPRLIDGARQERPHSPDLATLVDEIAAHFQVNREELGHFTPFKSHLIRQHPFMPLVNRHTLRTQLEALQSNLSSKVLVIDGPPGSGKSYSHTFIRYLADMLEAFKVVYIDLKEDYFPGYTPGDLISSIGEMMGLDLTTLPQKEAQDPRWSRELSSWLIGKLNAQSQTWWVVIDGVAQINLPQELGELIKRLATQAETQSAPLRVVLIDYGQMNVLPLNIQDKILSEQITPLQRQDIADFFQQWFASKGVAGPLNQEALAAIAEWVVASLDQIAAGAPAQRLAALPKTISAAEARLLGNPGGGQ